MNSTDPIVTAAQRLARTLLKNTEHCPDVEFIGVRTKKVGCSDIATVSGFDIRIDGNPDAAVLVARTFHAAAHMICLQEGVTSHSRSNYHNANFDLALEMVGAPEVIDLEELNKSQRAAAEALEKLLEKKKRLRPATKQYAYERDTLVCPDPECKHTLTLRKTAIARTRFLCVEHAEEMTVQDDK